MKKVIIITGASSGMGKDAALRLVEEGHIVYGVARRLNHMKDLEEAGGHAIKLDITNTDQVKEAVTRIIKEQGQIDVLFNNAGYAVYGSVEDVSIEDAKRQFDVNLFGLATITKAVLPYMRKQKQGTIINNSSMGGKMYTILGSWYHATKHALEGWSDCLRLELKPFNIDVVVIEPGAIRTEFGDVMNGPMLERSKGGPYEAAANTIAHTTEAFYSNPKNSSPASVITNKVVKAIYAKKPKTRYRAGKWAKPMVWMRIYLGGRLFDRVLKSQMK
ncbi:oxidoreductase [Tamlana sp. 2201CG12-4]|uniref:oxidoreductase n=1 Tax=Tamlana sp. 2201CG12-4 TaxID=3112582 RepID=UPI002DBF900F|nr:oxidoreductase [Tamlana sp. 2201CG12-4]MEC3908134.1 oxidoreductase [Tamlana sp. 2201CG12-4]